MKQPKQRSGKYTSLYTLTRLRHSEHLELRSENGKRSHYNFQFVCDRIKKTEISTGGYKDGWKNLSRWINRF